MKKAERFPPSSYPIRGGSGRSPSSLARYLIRGDSDEVHHRPQDSPHGRIGGAFSTPASPSLSSPLLRQDDEREKGESQALRFYLVALHPNVLKLPIL